MNIITVENLCKSFLSGREELSILRNVSFVLEEGKTLVVTGETGSGKSTLLNCIAGLERIDSGSITCAGWSVHELEERWLAQYRRETLGFIFQFHYLLGEFTALENVMLPAFMTGMGRAKARDLAKELLAAVNMQERLSHYPCELSGGERQRVAVARSLVNDPALILADEPTGNLDERNASLIQELLFDLVRKRGKTLILVTHDNRFAAMGDIRSRLEGGALLCR